MKSQAHPGPLSPTKVNGRSCPTTPGRVRLVVLTLSWP
ncbi:hypothetical protein BZL30_7448 [Mycobacterium kansasii]|uniref:Uncharacterized protein n=1 Tax=Mycobacterium kansasii TaxID=1768 RepID=A0A1V3WQH3_MYCKA|nr:hypothetical protein BZL30_7448 [Mycobacterium kansasii]